MEHRCFYNCELQVVIMMETHLIAYFNHINACWPGSGVRLRRDSFCGNSYNFAIFETAFLMFVQYIDDNVGW